VATEIPLVTLVAITPLDRLYPHLDQVKEWPINQTCRLLWDRTFGLQEQFNAASINIQNIAAALNDLNTLVEQVRIVAQQAYASTQAPGLSIPPPGSLPESCPDDNECRAGVNAAPATGDVGVVAQTRYEAGRVIGGTGNEYPLLLAPTATDTDRENNNEELLRRMIWHLQQAGFTAGRQRNPSSAISKDKLTVQADGELWAFDVFQGVDITDAVPVQAIRVCPADYVADAGIPD